VYIPKTGCVCSGGLWPISAMSIKMDSLASPAQGGAENHMLTAGFLVDFNVTFICEFFKVENFEYNLGQGNF
jgi:hypothetical protein